MSEKSAAQVAYESLIDKLKQNPDDDSATFAPPWDEVPEHVREAIEAALDAVASGPYRLEQGATPGESEASFAELGYRAYVKFTGGLNYQGLPCPKWPDLPEKIRGAWDAASLAVRTEHDSRHNIDLDWLESDVEEVAELVAALDSYQGTGGHRQHVLVPLRARLRAVLNPPAEEPEDDDAPDSASAATESPSTERSEPESSPGSSPLLGAPEGDTAAPPDVDLPRVSEAPAAPDLKVDLGAQNAPALGGAETPVVVPAPSDAPNPIDVEPKAAQLEVPAQPGSADAPAVGVAPEGHVQTSAEAAHTQTPDTKVS